EVISVVIHLLEYQEDICQGRLPELQREAQIGWDAAQRGEIFEGTTALTDIFLIFKQMYDY
ncbi:MAG: type II toxin-antitoxin system ParD family antitoxin, partial [Cyanobacteria bacterium J06626_18]